MSSLERISAVLVTAWMVAAAPAAAQNGSIAGIVVDDQGVPAAGSRVRYDTPGRMPGPKGLLVPDPSYVFGSVTAGMDGKFLISGLPPGAYTLCASGATQSQLSQCQWVNGGTHVTLAQGQAATGAVCQVAEGTVFVFTVTDTNGKIRDLADQAGSGPRIPLTGANFGLGGFVGSRYVGATLVSNSGGIRTYTITVPKGASLAPYVGTALTVTDASGVAITTGSARAPVPANGASQVALSFVVP